jgi:hypothetical protein
MSLQAIPILSFDANGGLKTNKKPHLIPEQAWQTLENGYVYRDRVRKREGLELVGRLRRLFSGSSIGNSGASPWSFNIYSTIVPAITPEANAEIEPDSVEITVGAVVFSDNGNGTLTGNVGGNTGTINYLTGDVVLTTTVPAGTASTITFGYHPGLPVMGISQRELSSVNFEQTIFFDTKYAYQWTGSAFVEFAPGTTWDGGDSDFFWTTNYRGVSAADRLFFVTNFVNDASNPMRYYSDAGGWSAAFQPLISATDRLYQARILIPYYGRLLALNTWEGTSAGGRAGASNYFNRCRFSQIGDPTNQGSLGPYVAGSWAQDVFGKGGFLDAPTNEQIISAVFINNTLVVFFENTTWQLRYVGEYGLPFVWERIASDFGCESPFSVVLFNDSVLAVGDKAIIEANAIRVNRIDLDIPDQIFDFQNKNDGVLRVHGIRDYQRELVFWCYPNAQIGGTYPYNVLVYNYRNRTWAVFRDNVTTFGYFQSDVDGITWDREDIFWDDEDVSWDDVSAQSRFPFIVSGNQLGFIHKYGYTFPDEQSLAITGVSTSASTLRLTIPDHNLYSGETIRLTGLLFVNSGTLAPVSTDLNNKLYNVIQVIDSDTIVLAKWNFVNQSYETNFSYTPVLASSTYIGGGKAAYFPSPYWQTKDFNPYQGAGLQTKLSRIDFLMNPTDTPTQGAITGATQANPCVITSTSHGLQSGQKITISGVVGMTQLNVGTFYTVLVIDANSFSIGINSSSFTAYSSGGMWTLLSPGCSVDLSLNASASIKGNLLVGNNQLNTSTGMPFYGPSSKYVWYRFYATSAGQFFNVALTYDDNLMNTYFTHTQNLELNGFTMYALPGGKIMF